MSRAAYAHGDERCPRCGALESVRREPPNTQMSRTDDWTQPAEAASEIGADDEASFAEERLSTTLLIAVLLVSTIAAVVIVLT